MSDVLKELRRNSRRRRAAGAALARANLERDMLLVEAQKENLTREQMRLAARMSKSAINHRLRNLGARFG